MGEESILIKGFGARRGSQVVRPGTANPLFAGSIPARASILLRIIPPRSRASPFQVLYTCVIVDWPCLRGSLHSPAELLGLYTRKLLIKGKSEWNDLKRNCIQSICPREKGPR